MVVRTFGQRGVTRVGVVVCVLALIGSVTVLIPSGGVAAQTSPPIAPDVPSVVVPTDLCAGAVATIAGTPGDDVLIGTNGDDVIVGGDGDDVIVGGLGDDLLCGGGGADDISGNEGADFVSGGDGDDVLGGGMDDDVILGGPGNDSLRGRLGADSLFGGPGDDFITGNEQNDVILGGAGADDIGGGMDDDLILGGDGDDVIDGKRGADTIFGEAGNDDIRGRQGADVIVGGVGDDTLSGGKADDQLFGQAGDDTIAGKAGDDFLDGGADMDSLDGDGGTDVCDDGETNVECETETNNGDPVGGDSDGDGVDDAVEAIFGLVPGSADSDGDGLSDRFEIEDSAPFLWPDDADSDDDGVGDADEDNDADGLTALQEQTFGTDPLSADTDGDGSIDGTEIAAGTDPLDPDSDGDGLSDGAETAAGTDPLDADSDGDGVTDGSDQVSISTTDLDSGATVTLTGTGDISEEPTITDLGDVETLGGIGRAGPAIDIALSDAASSALTSASVTLPFDSGLVGATSVAIFTYDEDLQAWVPAADPTSQTVDATAGTVTSPVSHFSMFAVVDFDQWFAALVAANATAAACSVGVSAQRSLSLLTSGIGTGVVGRAAVSGDGAIVVYGGDDPTDLDTQAIYAQTAAGVVTLLSSGLDDGSGLVDLGSGQVTTNGDGSVVAWTWDTIDSDGSSVTQIVVVDSPGGTYDPAGYSVVSVNDTGDVANRDRALFPSMSDDGQLVVFQSNAGNLAPPPLVVPSGSDTIYLHDRATATTTVVSVNTAGQTATGPEPGSSLPVISGDGNHVAFTSSADNMGTVETDADRDVYVRDLTAGTTTRVSVSSTGDDAAKAGLEPTSTTPSISSDGRFVAFASDATNLGSPEGDLDIYLHDRDPDANGAFDEGNGTTTLLTPADSGTTKAGITSPTWVDVNPALSGDAQFVTWISIGGDIELPTPEVVIQTYDIAAGAVTDEQAFLPSSLVHIPLLSMTADGSQAIFTAYRDIAPVDTNNESDVYTFAAVGDSDSDGLSDCGETTGLVTANLDVYQTDPNNADTDGDELFDGFEVGTQVDLSANPFLGPYLLTLVPDVFYVGGFANPTATNSDKDGLGGGLNPSPGTAAILDWEEFNLGTDPRHPDTDRDSIDDWKELDGTSGFDFVIDPQNAPTGTDPLLSNTDGDGRGDREEAQSVLEAFTGIFSLDFGLFGATDPRYEDHDDLTTAQRRDAFLQGLVCGELDDGPCAIVPPALRNSSPYTMGLMVSGFVVGAPSDIRDLTASALNGDGTGLLLNGAALVPFAGNAVAYGRGVGKVIRNSSDDVAQQFRRIARGLDDDPGLTTSAKITELRRVDPGFANDIDELIAVGANQDEIIKLARRGVRIDNVAAAGRLANGTIETGASKFRWRPAERFWRDMDGFDSTGRRFLANVVDSNGNTVTRRRVIDAWDPDAGRAIEVKVDAQSLTPRIRRQIDADVALRDADFFERPDGYGSIEWHFYVSDASKKVVDDPALFNYLDQNSIPFFIHLP